MGRIVSAITSKFTFVSGLAILLMVAIMTMDVVLRYLLKRSVLDTMEISTLLLGAVTSLALAFVTDKGEHISFTLLIDRLSSRGRGVAKGITLTISTALFALLTWQTTIRAIASLKGGEFIGSMQVPLWPSKFLFAVGCGLTLLVLVAQLITLFHPKEEC
jgi:TRAP-type C4-dicarboxylate transport system permease small subunit